MAKATPEGKVKKVLLNILKSFGSECFYYMPVQNGMGQTGIPDVMAIISGVSFAFECKATPKQHPTVLQAYALDKIHSAGGIAWVVDNENIDLVSKHIEQVVRTAKVMVLSDDNWLDELSKGEKTATLYRWRSKLEVMEFEDGTCS